MTVRPVLGSAFAVPIAEARLPGCEALNRELEALFLSRETNEYRNPTPSHVLQSGLFESKFNLFRWPESCVQRLREFVLEGVLFTVQQTTNLSSDAVRALRLRNHTWYHVTRYGGSFVAHNHPLASWSAVYCVRAGGAAPGFPDSGVLRFFDARAGASVFEDEVIRATKAPYALKAREYRLVSGQLVIFPSYLFHEVSPFYGADTRITVATNCWFD